MQEILQKVRGRLKAVGLALYTRAKVLWQKYRMLSKRKQVIVAVVAVVLLLSSHYILGLIFKSPAETPSAPSVTLSSIGELSSTGSGATIIGNVRSVSEASILAENGGKITRVHTKLGAGTGAGAVLAEIDNASARASVLQAEGAYESALAGRQGISPVDVAANARTTYSSAYTSVDSILRSYVDSNFYRGQGETVTDFLLAPSPFDQNYFLPKRRELQASMNAWKSHLANASTGDSQALLAEADKVTKQAQTLVSDIATATSGYSNNASASQVTAINTARTSLSGVESTIAASRQVNRSQSASATLGADASVKTALGTLRAAQALLEKTLIRTPIGGTVNFFPIRVGDYVTPLMHVATVAQNGALEVVSFVSESTREGMSVGQKVKVDETHAGVVTSIAPALDPVTKQIEVHVGVTDAGTLVDGQSVRISLPSQSVSSATSTGPLLLPLTAVKLTPSARVVFSVGSEGTLTAHLVEIGEVRGDRIEVLTQLPSELRIVVDARGRSEGEKVQIANQ